MGPQEAKEFFTEHLEERRRSYDDRKLTPGGEGFMEVYYPNPLEIGNQVKDYSLSEWATANGRRMENIKKEDGTMFVSFEGGPSPQRCTGGMLGSINMENDRFYAGTEWFAGGSGDPTKYEKSEIEIPVVEKKEKRTMVSQTCENCMHKGVCKYQGIFECICKSENLFSENPIRLDEDLLVDLTDLDFIELHRPTCKYFFPKNFTGTR